MMEKKDINREVEKTLNSLKDIETAKANPFLYTKLEGRLETETSASGYTRIGSYVGSMVTLLLIITNMYYHLSFSELQSTEISEDTGNTEVYSSINNTEILQEEYGISYSHLTLVTDDQE